MSITKDSNGVKIWIDQNYRWPVAVGLVLLASVIAVATISYRLVYLA